MLTIEDLKSAGITDEVKAKQIIDDLGDTSKAFVPVKELKKVHDDHDREYLILTGVQKDANETSVSYRKRALEVHIDKQITDKKLEYEGKVTELEEKLKAKPGDEKLIKELNELKSFKENLPKQKDEWIKAEKDRADKAESQLQKTEKVYKLSAFMPTAFKPEIASDSNYINFKREEVINSTLAKFDKIETREDGKTYLIDSTLNNATEEANSYFNVQFKSMLPEKNEQTGGGSGQNRSTSQSGGKFIVDKATSKEQQLIDIEKHIQQTYGITKISSEWDSLYDQCLIDNELKTENKKV
ncbi:MAG: hypothetical protein M0P71_17395 [Melioribacteraceae bacterium]|jgi:hypothetical protein|nr:hypothetical protein [Melioribacteraceae bacterium]